MPGYSPYSVTTPPPLSPSFVSHHHQRISSRKARRPTRESGLRTGAKGSARVPLSPTKLGPAQSQAQAQARAVACRSPAMPFLSTPSFDLSAGAEPTLGPRSAAPPPPPTAAAHHQPPVSEAAARRLREAEERLREAIEELHRHQGGGVKGDGDEQREGERGAVMTGSHARRTPRGTCARASCFRTVSASASASSSAPSSSCAAGPMARSSTLRYSSCYFASWRN